MHNLDLHGNMLTAPFYDGAVAMGDVFVAAIGSATTPVSFAKTSYDADQPQFVVDVPAGVTVVPLQLDVVLEDAAGTDTEVIWSTSGGNIGAGNSTGVTPVNAKHRADGNDPGTATDVYSLYTGNGTAPSGGYEFFRDTRAFAQEADAPVDHRRWSRVAAGWGPVIQGTGALVCHIAAASTAPAGFLTAVWFEYTT